MLVMWQSHCWCQQSQDDEEFGNTFDCLEEPMRTTGRQPKNYPQYKEHKENRQSESVWWQ